MANGMEGSYLLRDGRDPGTFSLSVRSKDSVKHFQIIQANQVYKFGITEFDSLDALIKHFANQPLLGGASGKSVSCNSKILGHSSSISHLTRVVHQLRLIPIRVDITDDDPLRQMLYWYQPSSFSRARCRH